MDDDILVKVENVSKKFCKSLKRSLWYGVQDIASELNPFARKTAICSLQSSQNSDDLRPSEFWVVKDVSLELKRGECLGRHTMAFYRKEAWK